MHTSARMHLRGVSISYSSGPVLLSISYKNLFYTVLSVKNDFSAINYKKKKKKNVCQFFLLAPRKRNRDNTKKKKKRNETKRIKKKPTAAVDKPSAIPCIPHTYPVAVPANRLLFEIIQCLIFITDS